VQKREEESSLMQLKSEFRNYEHLRREHDSQIIQIAMEAGKVLSIVVLTLFSNECSPRPPHIARAMVVVTLR
jgi:hypothetical protein